jgi:hypothetical protein
MMNLDYNQEESQQVSPYTEFFSWGSDSHGQLALANSEDHFDQSTDLEP